MTWALLVASLAVVTAACLVVYGNRPQVLHRRALRTVVVTTKTGRAFRGCLHDSDRDALVLKSAEALGDENVKVDGELLLHRSDIDTIQIP